jgi:hypothetical protein
MNKIATWAFFDELEKLGARAYMRKKLSPKSIGRLVGGEVARPSESRRLLARFSKRYPKSHTNPILMDLTPAGRKLQEGISSGADRASKLYGTATDQQLRRLHKSHRFRGRKVTEALRLIS